MSKKTVGILGGMGPLSTVELMRKIIEKTPVEVEQDHIRMLVDSRPEISDRTEFILGKGPSPIPMLKESAQLLEKWGAEMIAMPCNSAHAFYKEIVSSVHIPLLNMISLVKNQLSTQLRAESKILLLATTGTIRTKIYEKELNNFEIFIPIEKTEQKMVMEAIYGVKGSRVESDIERYREKINQVIQMMMPLNPQAVIAGCTEVELALQGFHFDIPIIFPLDLLASGIVKLASN